MKDFFEEYFQVWAENKKEEIAKLPKIMGVCSK